MRLPHSIAFATAGLAVTALALTGCASTPAESADGTVQVVASTNVYGDIAQQIGGDLVSVTSFITSAAQDPHSYEASAQDQLALSKADIVIENGGGYDPFIDTLMNAAGNDEVAVINATEASGLLEGDDHSHDEGRRPRRRRGRRPRRRRGSNRRSRNGRGSNRRSRNRRDRNGRSCRRGGRDRGGPLRGRRPQPHRGLQRARLVQLPRRRARRGAHRRGAQRGRPRQCDHLRGEPRDVRRQDRRARGRRRRAALDHRRSGRCDHRAGSALPARRSGPEQPDAGRLLRGN
jgi:hypothetical protein